MDRRVGSGSLGAAEQDRWRSWPRLALGLTLGVALAWGVWELATGSPEAVGPGGTDPARDSARSVDEAAQDGDAMEVSVAVVPRQLREPAEEASAGEVAGRPKGGIRSQPRLFGGAKVEPLYDPRSDALAGVRVSRVRKGSFWERLGVRGGDVVLEVNGELVDTPAASVKLINDLSEAAVLILRVRGEDGLERYLEYRS